ncbi:unnamed protein product [Didymodactylos carnosus]|uniref:Peptidase S1 domain-containing protein n=1 Tax=Didymodactylos carnosus TaxID=1234261 RepID=A0A8S2EUH9_9BILA|nr:unnamed protein product [Didymodactylos carnosus]CAF4122935.1 unnamed protein product [Didymodactylos carnosus]
MKTIISSPTIVVIIGTTLLLVGLALALGLSIALTPGVNGNLTLYTTTLSTTTTSTTVKTTLSTTTTTISIVVRTVPSELSDLSCNSSSSCGCQTQQPVFQNFTSAARRRRKRVVGGTSILSRFTWPWMILIGTSATWKCTGVLIGSSTVLTTASCLYQNILVSSTNTIVAYGITNATTYGTTTTSIAVQDIVFHPNFTTTTTDDLELNDIAILTLESAVPSTYPYICLSGTTITTIEPVVLTGYGSSDISDTDSGQLRQTILQTDPTCSLASTLDDVDLDAMLCAGYSDGLQDACTSDNGAPLMMYDSTFEIWNLIGLVSTPACGDSPSTIYTRISSYTDWIDDETAGKYDYHTHLTHIKKYIYFIT